MDENETTAAVLPTGARRGVGAVALLALLAVTGLLSRRPLTDYDLPWNLATGRLLVATRSIPRLDDLAFTHGPLRYVEVLGDVFFHGVDWSLHGPGLQLVGALSCAGAVLVTFLRMRRAGLVAYLISAWLTAAGAQWFTVRPATLSLLLLPIGLLVVDVHRENPVAWKRLVPVVPLSFVWANVHGMVAFFCALLVAYGVATAITSLRAMRPTTPLPRRSVATTAVVIVAALAAASVNTLGPALLLGPLRGDEVLGGITEWARPTPSYFVADVPVASALLLFSLLATAFGREPDGRRALPLFDVAVTALALFGFLSVVRLTPLSLLLVTPIAARRLAPFVPSTLLVALAAALAAPAAAVYVALFVPRAADPGFERARFPVAATDFVTAVKPVGQMYNFMPFGGYLAYRLYPTYRVFMDGRNTLARSAAFVKRAQAASKDALTFDAVVLDDHLEWAMTTSADGEVHDLPLARSAAFRMIYLDDVAAIYVRRDGPNAKLSQRGYRALRHLIQPAALLDEAMRDGPVAVALGHDGALALTQAPDSPRACFLAAAGGIAVRDEKLFSKGVGRLAELAPSHPAFAVLERAWDLRMHGGAPAP